jgi:hypothetical protein
MAHKSKASLACLANLAKALQKSFKATVEDAAESHSEDRDLIPFRNDSLVSDNEGEEGLSRIRG